MLKYLRLILVLLGISFILTGCLVSDKSTGAISEEEKGNLDIVASEITEKFFAYNEYDSKQNKLYNVQGILNLLEDRGNQEILYIDSILRKEYDKTFNELKEELLEQSSIFERQAQSGNSEYKIWFEFKGDYSQGDYNYSNKSYEYEVLFRVFESIENNIPLLTDNGIITFEIKLNKEGNWLINKLNINYQDLGRIKL